MTEENSLAAIEEAVTEFMRFIFGESMNYEEAQVLLDRFITEENKLVDSALIALGVLRGVLKADERYLDDGMGGIAVSSDVAAQMANKPQTQQMRYVTEWR